MKKLILAGVLLFTTMVGQVQAEELSKKDIEKIIGEYIAVNGGEIADSVDRYLEETRREAAANLVSEHTPVFGNKDAKVTLIEFSDFRCGYCHKVQETISQLREKYEGKVRFAFKNMPILTEESRQAALAGLAAHKQGKFWEFNAKLWDNQPRLGDELFVELAKEVGLDVDQFNTDRASEEIFAQVQIDFEDGKGAGVQGTPHFIINGKALSGAQPISAFIDAIDEALESIASTEPAK
tara:strand:- start:85456 stop:86169 length:714 start_codon:yes stop_codon:yes gene_type:complete